MKLIKVNDRIFYSMYEEERDRPILGYIRGSRWSLAVDAGHSERHVREFYETLKKEGLPLPFLTILTHWHWDHTFGMHAVNGLTLANKKTNDYLKEAGDKIQSEGTGWFFSLGESTVKEYAGGQKVQVVPADMVFEGEVWLNPGGLSVTAFQAESPHTDDSTVVYVPSEKVLFLGDAVCGEFPSWRVNPEKMQSLIRTIEGTNAEYCLNGHWESQTREAVLEEMRRSLP